MTARVHFYVLNERDRETSASLHVGGQGYLVTDHPPAIGDMICINGLMADPADEDGEMVKVAGNYRVVDRRWMPASYGSVTWPYGERQDGPEWLDVMLAPEARRSSALAVLMVCLGPLTEGQERRESGRDFRQHVLVGGSQHVEGHAPFTDAHPSAPHRRDQAERLRLDRRRHWADDLRPDRLDTQDHAFSDLPLDSGDGVVRAVRVSVGNELNPQRKERERLSDAAQLVTHLDSGRPFADVAVRPADVAIPVDPAARPTDVCRRDLAAQP